MISLHSLVRNLSAQPIEAARIDRAVDGTALPPAPPGAEGRERFHGPYAGRYVPAPTRTARSRSDGQAEVWRTCLEYLRDPSPAGPLVLASNTGFGKTHLMARLASMLGASGHRVFYAGPRRSFFDVVLDEVRKQGLDESLWRAWLPRQSLEQAAEKGGYETCRYAQPINSWLTRGYRAIDFCRQFCGWDYVHNGCPYYEQGRASEEIIYGHHNHVFLGNLLMERHEFDVIIGDEIALGSAVQNKQVITRAEFKRAMHDGDDSVARCMGLCDALLAEGEVVQGRGLLTALGGTEAVLEACALYREMATMGEFAPEAAIGIDGELVPETPSNFLPNFFGLLYKEAQWAQRNEGEYLTRIMVRPHGTTRAVEMLLRREVHPRVPQHIIWCDATPQREVYEAIFNRPVEIVHARMPRKARVIQVATRSNGKTALLPDDDTPENDKLAEAAQQAWHLVQKRRAELGDAATGRWGVVTFKDAKEKFESYGAETMHFGGARGENEFAVGESMDLGIVVGTPLPRLSDITRTAKMLWFDRMKPWDTTWSDRPYPFKGTRNEDGSGVWYHKSGFWGSPALMGVLWLVREAELLQMIGRFRPATHDAPIYVLSSLPIDEMAPDNIIDIADIFEAPQGTDPFLWHQCLEVLSLFSDHAEQDETYRWLTASKLAQEMDIDARTARRYLSLLAENIPNWIKARCALRGHGREVVLVRVPEAYSGPEGYDPAYWVQVAGEVRRLATDKETENSPQRRVITARDISSLIGVSLRDARHVAQQLVAHNEFEEVRCGNVGGIIKRSD